MTHPLVTTVTPTRHYNAMTKRNAMSMTQPLVTSVTPTLHHTAMTRRGVMSMTHPRVMGLSQVFYHLTMSIVMVDDALSGRGLVKCLPLINVNGL